MLKYSLLSITMLALLSGCGTVPAANVAARQVAPAALEALAFSEGDYKEATYEQVSSFWDREGSAAHKGLRFKVSGKLHANPPDTILEGWSATLSQGDRYAYVATNKSFWTRGQGERHFTKLGAGSGETVTVFLRVKTSSSTKDRVVIEAVKRADGTVVKG